MHRKKILICNCYNMEIYSHFAISTIFCKDYISEIQQKHHVVGNSRQLAPTEALLYNDCTSNLYGEGLGPRILL